MKATRWTIEYSREILSVIFLPALILLICISCDDGSISELDSYPVEDGDNAIDGDHPLDGDLPMDGDSVEKPLPPTDGDDLPDGDTLIDGDLPFDGDVEDEDDAVEIPDGDMPPDGDATEVEIEDEDCAAGSYAGTVEDPILIGCNPLHLPFTYSDTRDTSQASSDHFDSYPPNELDESGPEYIYIFSVDREVRVNAFFGSAEPDGVDVDLHLLSSLDPLVLIDRGHTSTGATLQAGTYFLILDTYVEDQVEFPGPYDLRFTVTSTDPNPGIFFNSYILDAIDFLYLNYALLGYDSAVLTHDIAYGDFGWIERSGGARTMCVAAVMEVILTGMQLYEDETGDTSVWDFLPKSSWEYLGADDIKAHIWVNHELNAGGTADALRNFGMGEVVPFDSLTPGSFINLNRTTGTGHAVVFLSYIDEDANEYVTYNDDVIGFRYFSAQGLYAEGSGGLDYRYAIFETAEYENNGYPEMPYKRDFNIIYSDNQLYLNTGMMYLPEYWVNLHPDKRRGGPPAEPVSFFDVTYFDGLTADD